MLWAFRIRPNLSIQGFCKIDPISNLMKLRKSGAIQLTARIPISNLRELTKKNIETRQILLSLIINCWGQAPFLQISLKISVLRLGEQIKRYFSSMYLMSMNKNYKRLLVSRISVLFKDCFRKGLGKERQRRIWKLNSWLNQNQQNE